MQLPCMENSVKAGQTQHKVSWRELCNANDHTVMPGQWLRERSAYCTINDPSVFLPGL